MVKCEVCNWEGKHQGALNLHKIHCRYKNMDKQQVSVPRETKAECEHEFRFLNSSNELEHRAKINGYSEVCVKCQSLQV